VDSAQPASSTRQERARGNQANVSTPGTPGGPNRLRDADPSTPPPGGGIQRRTVTRDFEGARFASGHRQLIKHENSTATHYIWCRVVLQALWIVCQREPWSAAQTIGAKTSCRSGSPAVSFTPCRCEVRSERPACVRLCSAISLCKPRQIERVAAARGQPIAIESACRVTTLKVRARENTEPANQARTRGEPSRSRGRGRACAPRPRARARRPR